MKIYLSKKPETKGGGSNTFAWNFVKWAKKNGHKVVSKIESADKAVIIAHYGVVEEIKKARQKGIRIIQRVDEYLEKNETGYRSEKHEKIIKINQYADITVFQSQFTYQNVYPFLKPEKYEIIINGGNQEIFHPSNKKGKYIGHITWSVAQKKRLDILYEKIKATPDEKFLLVGRQNASEFNFDMKNVILLGEKKRRQLPRFIRKMKVLFYPSEKDPCSNTVIEAILSGVPVCYNTPGGASEIVKDCGVHISEYQHLIDNLDSYRERCLTRTDLYFDRVAEKYIAL